jgi:hypothetical protein
VLQDAVGYGIIGSQMQHFLETWTACLFFLQWTHFR